MSDTLPFLTRSQAVLVPSALLAPASSRGAPWPAPPEVRPLPARLRWASMARVALRMLLHDRLRTGATIFGVVFTLALINSNLATFDFLLHRNTMFLDNAGADIWIVPAGTKRLDAGGGAQLPIGALMQAKVTPGVAWAEPLVWGHASVKLPSGGAEGITVVGAHLPIRGGGPFNMVAGSPAALAAPDTMIVEDSQREKLGGLNLGSSFEVNGRRVRVGGFCWGLIPFGPSISFAEYDLAREILQVDSDRLHYVMVRLDQGADGARVIDELKTRIPVAQVLTEDQLRASTWRYVMIDEGVGPMVGSATVIGIIVGFSIVSLMMFLSVIENLREFATLKAMGATNGDLARILLIQSLVFATVGSIIGVFISCQTAMGSRQATYNLVLRPGLVGLSILIVSGTCILASLVALLRIRNVEPAQVFR